MDYTFDPHAPSLEQAASPYVPPSKSKAPFKAAENRQSEDVFRVVVVASGNVSCRFVPGLVGMLSKDPQIAIQVVATNSALKHMSQEAVDAAVHSAWNLAPGQTSDFGVTVWTDDDQWPLSCNHPGETVLHSELRKWADLVVVAPCCADTLAKIAAGMSDSLALSLLRALSPNIPVILCPAMTVDMFVHPFTAKHLRIVREELGYMVLEPSYGPTTPARPGTMTDWRDIALHIEDFAGLFCHHRAQRREEEKQAASGESSLVVGSTATISEDTGPDSKQNTAASASASDMPSRRRGCPVALDLSDSARPRYATLSKGSNDMDVDSGGERTPNGQRDGVSTPTDCDPRTSSLGTTSSNPQSDHDKRRGTNRADSLPDPQALLWRMFHQPGLTSGDKAADYRTGPSFAGLDTHSPGLTPLQHWKEISDEKYWSKKWWIG